MTETETMKDYKKQIDKSCEYIKNFSDTEKIKREDYVVLFTNLLNLEEHAREIDIMKYNIKDTIIHQISSRIFEINIPNIYQYCDIIKKRDTIILENAISYDKYKFIIIGISKKSIKITFKKAIYPEFSIFKFLRNEKYNIKFLHNNRTTKCCYEALSKIQTYRLMFYVYPEKKSKFIQPEEDVPWFNTNVEHNPAQKQAVINILNKSACPAPYILFGPPGTGKTTTIIEIVYQIWKKDPINNILICTPSNAAADEITKRLIKVIPHQFISRLYASSIERKDIPKDIQKYPCLHSNGNFISKNIFIMTLVTSYRLEYLKGKFWSHIIIDECSQAIEPETLIPILQLRICKTSQIVVAGDPYQLGPVILSKVAQPLLGKSMLERLMEFPMYQKDKVSKEYDQNYITKLLQNYRSHKCIVHLPNKLFYENEIKCNNENESNMALGWSLLPNKKFPLIFHAVNGKEKAVKLSSSIYNFEEITIVIRYLKALINNKLGTLRIKEDHIGIITPYKEQHNKLINVMNQNNWKNITLGTVEQFQGQEKEIIILTTVRSRSFIHNDTKNIGFLSNPKRFNVALTRAKALFIIIGNPEALLIDSYWKELIDYCMDNGACIGSLDKKPA